jgi:ParB/RepB/Spo0J family partition protein
MTKDPSRRLGANAAVMGRRRELIPLSQILPDDRNRLIEEDEDFQSLVDSVKVLGVLQPLQVKELQGGEFRLVDGERRWRAAQKAGLEEVACEVWPLDSSTSNTLVAGLVLNEHRKAHGCIAVARRLREIKNELGLTQEELSARTGLPLDRVKSYGSLFRGSDELIEFFEQHEVPLKVALELVRYERATNEGRTRKLLQRYLESPLSRHQIAALRQRAAGGRNTEADASPERLPARPLFAGRMARAFERDPERARAELEEVLSRLGLRLAPSPVGVGGPGTL